MQVPGRISLRRQHRLQPSAGQSTNSHVINDTGRMHHSTQGRNRLHHSSQRRTVRHITPHHFHPSPKLGSPGHQLGSVATTGQHHHIPHTELLHQPPNNQATQPTSATRHQHRAGAEVRRASR